jgi:uncharacterized protein (TIGR03067 family)
MKPALDLAARLVLGTWVTAASAVDKGMEAFQGSWAMISLQINGEKVSEAQVKTGRLVVEGDRYTPTLGTNSSMSTYKLDTTASPSTIDFTFVDGPQKGKTVKGIYAFDGETLRICRGLTEADARPSVFAAPEDSGALVVVWKRAKGGSPAESDAAKAEYARFEGTWSYESVEVEGKAVPDDVLKTRKLILKGNQFTLQQQSPPDQGTFKVDVSKSPKTIDVTFTGGPEMGRVSLGIYELEGDVCRVCIGLVDKPRPTTFISTPNSGHVLEVLKRLKPRENHLSP